MDRLRIFLIEHSKILSDGLRACLDGEADLQVVGTAATIMDATAAIAACRPSVVLADLDMPGRGDDASISEICRCAAGRPLVLLGATADAGTLRAAMGAGAMGFVLKETDHAELSCALRAASAGRRFVCTELANKILAGYEAGDRAADGRACEVVRLITQREREVLMRIALGQSNKLSARHLGLSVKTVEKHRSNMMRKLRLHNTAAVTMFALRHGLVHQEDARVG